jgi:uncharacterized repeat protein (TIGR01451 family)
MGIKGALKAITGAVVLLVLAGSWFSRDIQAAQKPAGSANGSVDASTKTSTLEMFRRSPMSFVENQGQSDNRVKFTSRGAGYALFLTRDGAVMKLQNPESSRSPLAKVAPATAPSMPYIGNNQPGDASSQSSIKSVSVLNMRLVGANPEASITALDRQKNTSNYFIGNDHSKWRTNVSNFGKVRYAGVYPGVDLVYYGNQRQLEYDFVVAPGADPNVIALHFGSGAEGAESLSSTIDNNGDLVAHLEGGDVRFHKPVVYQSATYQSDDQQHRNLIDGRYVLRASGQVGFELGTYDRSKELVIDPTLTYSTYLGGSNVDVAFGVAVDCCGSAFVTGSTLSTDFPVTAAPNGALQPTNAGEKDIFVTKFDAGADSEEYSTYVGGSGDDVATDIHLDNLGDMTVTGYTLSTDFPLELPIQGTFGGGSVTGDAFLFQIASHGTAFVYSTYFGGSSDDQGFSLALDSDNNVYVVGYTSSTNFPVIPGSLHTTCGSTAKGVCSNGFVLKVNVPPGQGQQTSLVYSTYLGGSGGLGDAAYGIWVDNTTSPAPGIAYVVGITGSPNFPVTKSAFDQSCGTDGKCNGTYDGFVAELAPGGNALTFSTFLGGSGYDYAAGVAVDSTGVYVSGNTTSTNFPVTKGAAQKTFGGMSSGCVPSNTKTCGDVTLSKLNPTGSALLYSTYLGGSLDENPGLSMALDPGGSVYVTGQTDSTNFPLVTPLQGVYRGAVSNAFLTKLNPEGTAFSYSTYVGGSAQDSGSRVILDVNLGTYVSGTTTSTNFPTTAGVFQPNCGTDGNCNGGLSDAFVFKVSTSARLSIAAAAPKTVVTGKTLTYTIASGNSGPDDASVVAITDALPTGTTFQSVTISPGTCTAPAQGATGTVTCTIGLQPVGARIRGTIVVNVTAAAGAMISNTIGVNAPNSTNSPSATVVTTVEAASALDPRRKLLPR